MFLSNWLILQIVAAGVTGAVEYPSAADFFMNFDSNNRLYFTGGSKDYVSNLILYKGETEYPVYNGSVSNIYISDPASYVSYIQLCGETYVTNTVDVQSVTQVAVYDYASSTEQILLGEAANNNFGYSVSIDGDYAIVGAVNGSAFFGAAYIYKRDGTTWTEQANFAGEARFDEFGVSVSISGDYAIVGARLRDSYTGAVYIYTRSGTSWSQQQRILGAATGDYFGTSVSISGDYAIVGAFGNDTAFNNAGAAYIYKRNGTTWTQQEELNGEASGDYFGTSVSISGDYAIVGAPYEAAGGARGAAYIYKRDTGAETWTEQDKLLGEANGDYFGQSVSISGDYAIVGAYYEATGGAQAGAAYIYKRDTGAETWTEQDKLLGETTGDEFGWSVSIDGDYAIVGAYHNNSSTGAAYIFKRSGTSWTQQKKLLGETASDTFGWSVSIDGDYAIVGARRQNSDTGAAYIYEASNLIPTLTQDEYNKLTLNNLNNIQSSRLTLNSNTYTANGPVSKFFVNEPGTYEVSARSTDAYAIVKKTVSAPITLTETDIALDVLSTEKKINGEALYDYFGTSVSLSGDYAIVGATGEDTGGSSAGAAYIYKRDGMTWAQQAKFTGEAPYDYFGESVSIDGDYAIVGSRLKNSNTGAAYIFVRSGTSWSQQANFAGETTQNYFGQSVSISGDYAIVGAIGNNSFTGAAYIYTRSGTTWTQQAKFTGAATQDQFGRSVSIDGDYAIVGAFGNDTGGNLAGAAYIFVRSGTSWTQQANFTGEAAQDYFGYSVSINGDYAIVGANSKNSYTGAAYIYTRSGTTWTQQANFTGEATDDSFGTSVSLSGNYAIIGAERKNTYTGAAYIYTRSGTTWTQQTKFDGNATDDYFGTSVSISGDYAIVTASRENSYIGGAYIYKLTGLPSPKLTYDTYNILTLSNVNTTYSSTLRYESNTYDIGTASTIIIRDPGRYEIATTDNGNFLSLNSNVTGQTVTTQVVSSLYNYTNTTEQQILLGEVSQDQFGYSVSIDGDYAIVGAIGEDEGGSSAGAAYIFVRSGTSWTQQAKFTGEATNDLLGWSVSISGDYAIVGATGEDTGGSSAGAVYIYTRSGTTWTQQAKFTGEATNDTFGTSVSISGDYAIVGAPSEGTGGTSAGAAYIYTRSGTTWTQQDKLLGDASNSQFGTSVSISGDYAIIGAERKNTYTGAAYIYKRNGTTWTEQDDFAGTGNYNYFGTSVSISGDYAIIGASSSYARGDAYIYKRDTGAETWTQQANFSGEGSQDEFARSVNINGDYAIVGSAFNSGFTGAAYIYTRSGTSWSQEKKISGNNDNFGKSVSLSGGYAIVGASSNSSFTGAAYIYTAEENDIPPIPPTLAYDGLNTLVLSNVSTGSYNTFLEGSNVLACATDLTTYPVPKSGITGTFTYSARTKTSSTFAFTNYASITDYYKTYQYPPIDGTTTGLTSSTTSATWTISGVQYSTESSVAGTPYNTFDNSITSGFDSTSSTGDITITFESAKTIRKYIVWPYDSTAPVSTPGGSTDPTLSTDGTFRPKSWVLKGSNDGTNWTDLDTVTNQPPSIYGDVHSISSPASYQYYKLSVTANNGGSGLKIGEWQLWGDA